MALPRASSTERSSSTRRTLGLFTAVTRHALAGGDDARLRLGYLRAAHDDQRLLPVIVITARSDASSLAVAKGVARLMQKPLDIPVLLETMRDLPAVQPRTQTTS
jgi:CheY-like chemotaxis protein